MEVPENMMDMLNLDGEDGRELAKDMFVAACANRDVQTASWLRTQFEFGPSDGCFGDALSVAAAGGDTATMEWLVDAGITAELGYVKSALMNACKEGNKAGAKWILDRFEYTEKDIDVASAVKVAYFGNTRPPLDIVKVLLDHFKPTVSESGAAEILCDACARTIKGVVRLLLYRYPELTATDARAKEAFIQACIYGDIECLEFLMETFKMTADDADATKALHMARREENTDAVNWIIDTFDVVVRDRVDGGSRG